MADPQEQLKLKRNRELLRQAQQQQNFIQGTYLPIIHQPVSRYDPPSMNKEDLTAALWLGGIGTALGLVAFILAIGSYFQ